MPEATAREVDMTKLELARAVNEARFGERALMATLFGIKHHRQLDGRIVAEILSMNNLPSGATHYDVAINRGRGLAKYVDLESGQYRAQAELTKNLHFAVPSGTVVKILNLPGAPEG